MLLMETLPFGLLAAVKSTLVTFLVAVDDAVGLWVAAAVGAAVLNGFKAAFQKQLTGSYTDKEVAYVNSSFALIILIPLAGWSLLTHDATITLVVVGAALISGLFNVGAVLMRMKALSLEDLSVVGPLASLTPIALALVEPAVLGIPFDPLVLIASVIAVIGAAVIISDDNSLAGLFSRVSTLGPLLAIGTSLAYTVTTLADKFAVSSVPPFQYALALHVMMAVGTWAVLYAGESTLSLDRSQLYTPDFHFLGLLRGGSLALMFVAFSLTHSAAQVAIILQLALIIDVFLGGVAMGEEDTLKRTAGVVLIIVGVGVVV